MKVFKNNGTNGSYYTTSFYHKDKSTGEETKRSVYVGFQKGYEPSDTIDLDLIARDKKGNEYNVILDCYKKNSVAEPKLFLFKKKAVEEKVKEFANDNSLNIEPDDFPFY